MTKSLFEQIITSVAAGIQDEQSVEEARRADAPLVDQRRVTAKADRLQAKRPGVSYWGFERSEHKRDQQPGETTFPKSASERRADRISQRNTDSLGAHFQQHEVPAHRRAEVRQELQQSRAFPFHKDPREQKRFDRASFTTARTNAIGRAREAANAPPQRSWLEAIEHVASGQLSGMQATSALLEAMYKGLSLGQQQVKPRESKPGSALMTHERHRLAMDKSLADQIDSLRGKTDVKRLASLRTLGGKPRPLADIRTPEEMRPLAAKAKAEAGGRLGNLGRLAMPAPSDPAEYLKHPQRRAWEAEKALQAVGQAKRSELLQAPLSAGLFALSGAIAGGSVGQWGALGVGAAAGAAGGIGAHVHDYVQQRRLERGVTHLARTGQHLPGSPALSSKVDRLLSDRVADHNAASDKELSKLIQAPDRPSLPPKSEPSPLTRMAARLRDAKKPAGELPPKKD